MKSKTVLILSSSLLLLTAMFSVAKAENDGILKVRTNSDVSLEARSSDGESEAKTSARANATTSVGRDDEDDDGEATSTKEENDDKGELTAEEHRSAVASFVKSLLKVADREGGIGAEVREVAQTQNDSATTTANAMIKIKSRSALVKFFFGSDYKSLGELRSQIVVTQNNIDQLNNLLDRTANTADQAEISAQIKVLEDLRVKTDAFIKANENVFSIFGWFIKGFQK